MEAFVKRALAACAVLVLAGCQNAQRGGEQAAARFVDIVYPVGKASAVRAFPHAVDGSGALWYIDGDDVIRQTDPHDRDVVHLPAAHSGNLFWYDNAIFVVPGDGSGLIRIDRNRQTSNVDVPSQFIPIVGAYADPKRRAIVIAQSAPTQMAVVDVWKWYGESLPAGISPLSAALAGGPHGKRYLVVADRRQALVMVKNRLNGNVYFVHPPENECFAAAAAPLNVPVDVLGRDNFRAWVGSGQHVASIDLRTQKILRVWDLNGCAMQLVTGDGDQTTVAVSAASGSNFVTSLVRVDRGGVHEQTQYGTIDELSPGFIVDRYGRLWWFDAKRGAFICRTPVG